MTARPRSARSCSTPARSDTAFRQSCTSTAFAPSQVRRSPHGQIMLLIGLVQEVYRKFKKGDWLRPRCVSPFLNLRFIGTAPVRWFAYSQRIQIFFEICKTVTVLVVVTITWIAWIQAITDLPFIGHTVLIRVLQVFFALEVGPSADLIL